MKKAFVFATGLAVALAAVCGMDRKTYDGAEAAHAAGTEVLHCDGCGKCSGIGDVDILNRTRDDLTKVTRACAVRSIVSRRWAERCVREKVGFSEGCLDCWVDNIICDRRRCLWKCLWSLLTNEDYVGENGKLNSCLQCDEDECGPDFKACAGANRRRACIHSDIFRDDQEICTVCDYIKS